MNINTDSSCSRNMDQDLALSGSQGQDDRLLRSFWLPASVQTLDINMVSGNSPDN